MKDGEIFILGDIYFGCFNLGTLPARNVPMCFRLLTQLPMKIHYLLSVIISQHR
jgi:hypothetical protein